MFYVMIVIWMKWNDIIKEERIIGFTVFARSGGKMFLWGCFPLSLPKLKYPPFPVDQTATVLRVIPLQGRVAPNSWPRFQIYSAWNGSWGWPLSFSFYLFLLWLCSTLLHYSILLRWLDQYPRTPLLYIHYR